MWQITHQDSGFTTQIDWKTNSPAAGQNNNALPLTTTTSTNGRGTWTLTFTNDTDGTVTAPDGTNVSFTLPSDPAWQADFANPVTIDFGTAPNNTAGYGQWITFKTIAISNVLDGTQYDDFTQDDALNTGLWNPAFSVDSFNAGNNNAGSVFLVSTNTPYWLNWTTPDAGYGLATATGLSATNQWLSPAYYGNGFVSNSIPTRMGTSNVWTLVPTYCLPTVDGMIASPISPTAFFRLQKPPPAQ